MRNRELERIAQVLAVCGEARTDGECLETVWTLLASWGVNPADFRTRCGSPECGCATDPDYLDGGTACINCGTPTEYETDGDHPDTCARCWGLLTAVDTAHLAERRARDTYNAAAAQHGPISPEATRAFREWGASVNACVVAETAAREATATPRPPESVLPSGQRRPPRSAERRDNP